MWRIISTPKGEVGRLTYTGFFRLTSHHPFPLVYFRLTSHWFISPHHPTKKLLLHKEKKYAAADPILPRTFPTACLAIIGRGNGSLGMGVY